MLIDTHAHLYLNNFVYDIDKVIDRAIKNNVKKIILPNIDENSINDLLKLKDKYKDVFYIALGLHPNSVRKDYKIIIDRIFRHYSQDVVAIGEIGIDLYWDKSFIKEQSEAFRIQIEYSIEKNKPLIIHSRKSMNEIFKIINDYKKHNIKGVFHCYSGSYEQAVKIIEMGFCIGIGGVLTFKNTSLVEVVKKIPIENIVLETDSPFLPPTPFRGKRNEPSYLRHIATKLSEIKNIDIEIVESITSKNSKDCFNI